MFTQYFSKSFLSFRSLYFLHFYQNINNFILGTKTGIPLYVNDMWNPNISFVKLNLT